MAGKHLLLILIGSFIATNINGNELFSCKFDEKSWNRSDWTFVKRPDWEHSGKWKQGEDFIENDNPTHTSMVITNKFQNDVTISCTVSFLERMAPSIVIASKLMENAEKRIEYQEHFEIVLWDKGINVWHLIYKDGKANWEKTAFWTFSLQKETKHEFTVTKVGNYLTIAVGNYTFGYIEKNLPNEYYVGITGCEGINRFYDFAIKEK